MTHYEENISNHHEGDSRILTVTVRDEDADGNPGDPIDITNYSFTYSFADSAGAEYDFQKSVGSGIEIIDATNGVLEVTLDPADTENNGGKTYYHELQYTDTEGNVATVFSGDFEIVLGARAAGEGV